ncbi:hypothetical protein ACFYPH_00170 [Micromonospora sp. NPDC005252]
MTGGGPALHHIGGLARRSAIDLNVDSLFEFGLQRLLDGVAVLVRP